MKKKKKPDHAACQLDCSVTTSERKSLARVTNIKVTTQERKVVSAFLIPFKLKVVLILNRI